MSGYKSFAIAGAGALGNVFVEELLRLKSAGTIDSVFVLTRPTSTTTIPAGAQTLRVDYDDADALAVALRGIDVLISTLSTGALAPQVPLAQAAKAAGVKLFVPSEFGNPTLDKHGHPGPLGQKADLHGTLKKLELPYALFYTGPWPEYNLVPFAGWDLPSGKVTIGGSGNAPISWTTRADIARFLGHALTVLPTSLLANKVFRIEGDRTTFNAILKEYQEKSGKKLEINYRPQTELQVALQKDPADFVSFLHLAWDNGEGVVGKPDELDNRLWSEWKPKRAVEVLL